MKKRTQLELPLPIRGGRRKGAGRKPAGKSALVSHGPRPKFERATPAHVTLRIADDVPSLRSSARFKVVRNAFIAARGRLGARIVEFNVLGNHLHLIVEADSSSALSKGMQGLLIRIAKALNTALRRAGKVFADLYHSRVLVSPTELVRAIRYVVENADHYGEHDYAFSSRAPDALAVLAPPTSWLVRAGWRRAAGGDRLMPIAVCLVSS